MEETLKMQVSEQMNILQNRIKELELENKNLHETIAYLTKKLYGKSSETSKALGMKGQMSLFDEAEAEADPEITEPTLEDVEQVCRKKKYLGQRKDKLDKLPHDKIIFKLNPQDLNCLQCGAELKPIGQEFIRTEIEYTPAKLRVIDYYRETYECRKCKNTGHPYIGEIPGSGSGNTSFLCISCYCSKCYVPEVCKCCSIIPAGS